MNNPMNSYHSKLGPIPLDHFGNDGDPAIEVETGEGSVVAAVIATIESHQTEGNEGAPESK